MFLWNSLTFSMIQWMLAIWSLVPLPFLNPAWTSGSSQLHMLKPGVENFEHYFASMWDECNCAVIWVFFGISFLWDWNENWPFPVLWLLLSFPYLLAIECSTFTASIFRTWNSSTGIPSPPLALFIVMLLPKAQLSLYFRMSGSRWVIIPLWSSICHFHSIIIRDWFRSYLNGLVVVPTFFSLSLSLAIKSSSYELQSVPGLVFADCIQLLHFDCKEYNLWFIFFSIERILTVFSIL